MAYYEYETSPRKIRPEFERETYYKVPEARKKVNTQSQKKTVKKANKVEHSMVFKYCAISMCIFTILLALIYSDSRVDEAFSKIQTLKTEMSKLQKENDQLEIGIQNSLNLNNIEQAAKEMLGMQKLSSKQIVYINLSKEDYVLPTTETVIIEDNTSLFIKIKNFIRDVF